MAISISDFIDETALDAAIAAAQQRASVLKSQYDTALSATLQIKQNGGSLKEEIQQLNALKTAIGKIKAIGGL